MGGDDGRDKRILASELKESLAHVAAHGLADEGLTLASRGVARPSPARWHLAPQWYK